jgi:hypothetical protein
MAPARVALTLSRVARKVPAVSPLFAIDAALPARQAGREADTLEMLRVLCRRAGAGEAPPTGQKCGLIARKIWLRALMRLGDEHVARGRRGRMKIRMAQSAWLPRIAT